MQKRADRNTSLQSIRKILKSIKENIKYQAKFNLKKWKISEA